MKEFERKDFSRKEKKRFEGNKTRKEKNRERACSESISDSNRNRHIRAKRSKERLEHKKIYIKSF